jgi:YfiH family protein
VAVARTDATETVTEAGWLVLGPARVRFTGRAEGDLGHSGAWVAVDEVDPGVASRRRAVLDVPWSWLRQVHGDTVVAVARPGEGAGTVGDALVATRPGPALAVLTADCAPVALVADNGMYAAVHAGWRGLVAGVIERAAEALRARGAGRIDAVLGPCIHAECYEFSPADLDAVAARFGETVRGETSDGRPALDVPAGVRAALASADAELVADVDVCTACSTEHFSYRRRGEAQRQALVVHAPEPS